MNVFYCPEIPLHTPFELPEEEFHHIKVLRYQAGDEILLMDGKGHLIACEISELSKKTCTIISKEIIKHLAPKPYTLHMAVAPTKNIERFEWFVEKAVEIGIHCITPILCKTSERKHLSPERLEKIIISAMKQSLSPLKPILNEMVSFEQFLKTVKEEYRFIAHCHESDEKKSLKQLYKGKGSVCLLIGPEGDFTPEEIQLAKQSGFLETSLGESRLRTETAALAACHTIAFINET